jgi:CBS domain-containing protein
VGILAGLLLNWILKRTDEPERVLIFSISSALLIIGVAITRQLDVIISSMALGVTLTNIGSKKVLSSFGLVHRFSAPIYVLFFVLVGARLRIVNGGTQVLLLAVVYIIGTAAGKTIGAWWGAVHSRAIPSIRKYLGFCLYQQGTIAIALLLVASTRFEGHIRDTMLSVIVAGVFVFQLVGPVFVKVGSKKAGEAGLNITEDDLIKTYNVDGVMNRNIPTVAADTTLMEIIRTFGNTDSFYYPVVDRDKHLIGAVTVDGIRNTLNTIEAQQWLIALDILEPVVAKTTPNVSLADALEQCKTQDLEYIPVVVSPSDETLVGVLDARSIRRMLSAEVLARQHKADAMQEQTGA